MSNDLCYKQSLWAHFRLHKLGGKQDRALRAARTLGDFYLVACRSARRASRSREFDPRQQTTTAAGAVPAALQTFGRLPDILFVLLGAAFGAGQGDGSVPAGCPGAASGGG